MVGTTHGNIGDGLRRKRFPTLNLMQGTPGTPGLPPNENETETDPTRTDAKSQSNRILSTNFSKHFILRFALQEKKRVVWETVVRLIPPGPVSLLLFPAWFHCFVTLSSMLAHHHFLETVKQFILRFAAAENKKRVALRNGYEIDSSRVCAAITLPGLVPLLPYSQLHVGASSVSQNSSFWGLQHQKTRKEWFWETVMRSTPPGSVPLVLFQAWFHCFVALSAHVGASSVSQSKSFWGLQEQKAREEWFC